MKLAQRAIEKAASNDDPSRPCALIKNQYNMKSQQETLQGCTFLCVWAAIDY